MSPQSVSAEPKTPAKAKTMTGRERMALAMRHQKADRVPVMCQLSIGHYMVNTEFPGYEIWHSSEVFAECLVRLARKYRFDGVMINLPGRPENWKKNVERLVVSDEKEGEDLIFWKNYPGATKCPHDDNAHHYVPLPGADPNDVEKLVKDNDMAVRPELDDIDLDKIYYDDPHTEAGLKYPYFFGNDKYEPPYGDADNYFPPHEYRTIELVRKMAPDLSVHGEFFSPMSQIMELFGYERALMGFIDNPDLMKEILARYAIGCIDNAERIAKRGVDALLMSSAFAGGGFFSKEHYEEFVLPCEQAVWKGIRARGVDIPFYVHTCGAIGDRLDLMVETGVDGIDTLDPPPLGNTDIEEAKRKYGEKFFFKGNVDSVSNLLQQRGGKEACENDIKWRLKAGKPNGGFVLSTACSVAPYVKPENIVCMVELAEEYGRYDGFGKEPGDEVKPLTVV
ncbi:MAG: hypothetical protein L6R28_15510 [Planctomycetes bacterium]|nr:hypothetical protein [Planctomycetota bacterium]